MTYSVKKVSALDKLRPQGVVAPVYLEVKRKGLWEGVDVCMCGGEGWGRCVWEGGKGDTSVNTVHPSVTQHSARSPLGGSCVSLSRGRACRGYVWQHRRPPTTPAALARRQVGSP